MSSLSNLSAETLLQSLTSGALATDEQGRIIYANPVFVDLSGYADSTLPDRPLSEWFRLPPKTDCALCLGLGNAWATVHGGYLPTQSGEELKVKIKHSRLDEQTVLCLVEPFSEDTTLTQAHSDFVSTVSHEFRTPLTSIKGFADTLLAYGSQLPDDEKRRFITIIKDQADRLIRLVENLLTVSKLGASRVELSYRPIPLQRLLEKVTHSIQAKIQAKQPAVLRQFEVSVNPASLEAWADADRLEQILINLIDNAVKYSPPDSLVRVRADLSPGDDTRLRIAVQDAGQGIPADLLPKIFTKFYRVETPLQQDVEGTGLGLYITQSLTTAMGGHIEAESQPGQGSTFTVTFPVATPELQAIHRRRLSTEGEGQAP